MTWLLDGRPLERVLVTRLRYLGDVVMSTAVTAALRQGAPGLDVGFLCEEAFAPVLDGHPDLARVHALTTRRRGADARARRGAPGEGGRGMAAMSVELRRERYDAAIDLFFNPRSAVLLRLSGIRGRLAGPAGRRGRLYTHCGRPGDAGWPVTPRQGRRDGPAGDARGDARAAGAALDRLAPGGLGEHLSRLGPLVHAESGLGFATWFASRAQPARTFLPRRGQARGAGALVLAPGATWPTKRWPPGHWRALAGALAAGEGRRVRVLAAPGEHADLEKLMAGLPAGQVEVLPEMPLPAVLAELSAAAGVVSADGGVMHAAVALGVPTLALFGPTDPRLWFPYEGLGPFRVLATRPPCHPCDLHECPAFICLPDLAPAVVAAAARELFAARDGSA